MSSAPSENVTHRRGNTRRRSQRHPIYHLPSLEFTPHRLTSRLPPGQSGPLAGELLLWRFRSEWQAVSKEASQSRLSRVELERVRNHPNRALGKRFAVSRAALRGILSDLLDREPGDIALTENSLGQPCLAEEQARSLTQRIDITVGYAGVWIIVGISGCALGLGTHVPGRAADNGSVTASGSHVGLKDVTQQPAQEQARLSRATSAQMLREQLVATRLRVRHTSLLTASGIAPLDSHIELLQPESPAFFVDLQDEGKWHILDVPMPGAICAAVAVAQPITRVHAFGWAREATSGQPV